MILTRTVQLTLTNFFWLLREQPKVNWMIDLELHLKCKFMICIIIFIKQFPIRRYDVSGDGQIDQKELATLISAMVKNFLYSSLINAPIHFSMILLEKPIVKVIMIQRNVLAILLPNLMLMAITS